MVGENFDLGSPPTGYEMGEVALSIENLTRARRRAAPTIRSVDRLSLDVRAGEIVCIYGLMGAGRTEMMEMRRRPAAGPPAAGSCCTARTSSRLSIAERIAAGLVLVPEDRQRDGLVQTMTVGQNLSLASIAAFTRGLFTSQHARAGADRPLDPRRHHQDLRRRRDDRLALRRQPAEGRHRQDAGDQPDGRPARRAVAAASTSAPRPRCSGCSPKARKRGLAVRLLDLRGRRVPERRPPHHRDAPRARSPPSSGPDVTKEKIMAASGEVDLQQQLAETVRARPVRGRHRHPPGRPAADGARRRRGEVPRRRDRPQAQPMLIGVGYGRTLEAGGRGAARDAGAARRASCR